MEKEQKKNPKPVMEKKTGSRTEKKKELNSYKFILSTFIGNRKLKDEGHDNQVTAETNAEEYFKKATGKNWNRILIVKTKDDAVVYDKRIVEKQ